MSPLTGTGPGPMAESPVSAEQPHEPGPGASVPDSPGAVPGTGRVPVPVVVVDTDPALRAGATDALAGAAEVSAHTELAEALRSRGRGAMVVVAGPSLSDAFGISDLETLIRTRPEAGVILIAEEVTTELLQHALRAGVRDVIPATAGPADLLEAVQRVAATLPAVLAPTRTGPTAVVGGDGDEPGERGRVITVFSTKGGSGKSVIASNLAVLLAQRSERPVVLVDADLQFGDISVMLKLVPQHTIVDAVGNVDRLDTSLLENLLATHEASGLRVLPAPLEPAFADQIGSEEMTRIIDVLRELAAYVVVDTPAYFNDVVLGLIEQSDEVLLVAGMDIPNIKNVKIGLQTLRLLNIPLTKLHLILNRANSKVKLEVAEVERTLGLKAESLIPSDVVVPQSVNKGIPVVLDAPRSSVARALAELADRYVAAPQVRGGRRRFF